MPKGGLDLSTPERIAHGSLHGAAVVTGKPDESLLWQRVEADQMPPQNPLTPEEKELLRRWIAEGAQGLPQVDAVLKGKSHWAFQTPTHPAIPAIQDDHTEYSDVDRLLLSKLQEKGLAFNSEADRLTLIRRVCFDLTGLPPSREEVERFLADENEDAYQQMVEYYLASPHYGERWGKYWLDAAGYADSNGYFHADTDRPYSYHYRDYVIRAFNQDKPYDRFLCEQIAGDEMAGYEYQGDLTGDAVDLLTATHFLRNAPDGTGESDGNPVERQLDRVTVIEGTVDITSSALLGLTIRCAKCHDHKFDPITQREYYNMQALFTAGYQADPERWLKPYQRVLEVGTVEERKKHRQQNEVIDQKVEPLKKSLERFAEPLRNEIISKRIGRFEDPLRIALRETLATEAAQRTDEQKQLVEENPDVFEVEETDLTGEYEVYITVRNAVREQVSALDAQRPKPLEKIPALFETHKDPIAHQIFIRGDHTNRGGDVQPGVPAVLCSDSNVYKIDPAFEGKISSGRRTAFAKWLTSNENPLTARVMINRIWQHHFEHGIVPTQSNFGVSGALPIHPALLDYLAVEFMERGWSIKEIHRMIMNSAVYKQSSQLNEDAFKIDPENRLLWRFPLKRLEAEALRDTMLFVSGELDSGMYGPYVPTNVEGNGQVVVDEDQPGAHKRSIYLQNRRTQVSTFLELYDCPSLVNNVTKRSVSTIPLQSLAMLNSEFVLNRAKAFADRVSSLAGDDKVEQIRCAFTLATDKKPDEITIEESVRFLDGQAEEYRDSDEPERRALNDLCQMILASSAFMYVE